MGPATPEHSTSGEVINVDIAKGHDAITGQIQPDVFHCRVFGEGFHYEDPSGRPDRIIIKASSEEAAAEALMNGIVAGWLVRVPPKE